MIFCSETKFEENKDVTVVVYSLKTFDIFIRTVLKRHTIKSAKDRSVKMVFNVVYK